MNPCFCNGYSFDLLLFINSANFRISSNSSSVYSSTSKWAARVETASDPFEVTRESTEMLNKSAILSSVPIRGKLFPFIHIETDEAFTPIFGANSLLVILCDSKSSFKFIVSFLNPGSNGFFCEIRVVKLVVFFRNCYNKTSKAAVGNYGSPIREGAILWEK